MQQVTRQVLSLVRAIEECRRALATALGIGATEANALAELSFNGARTPSDLAERLGLASPSVTALVDRLEHAGLVVRRRHPVDRRSVFIEMTPTGAAMMHIMIDLVGNRIAAGVGSAKPEQRRELDDLLAAIVVRVRARVADRESIAAGMARHVSPRRPDGDPPPE